MLERVNPMSINCQLQKIVNKIDLKIERATKEIISTIKEKLKEALYEYWYDKYDPIDYKRSFDLISAVDGEIVKNSRGNYSISVFINPKLLSAEYSPGMWSTHMGFAGENFREGLIYSILHGVSGSKLNPRLGDSANVIEVVQEEATRYANSILKQYLK